MALIERAETVVDRLRGDRVGMDGHGIHGVQARC
jgi:hypothetical protein